jgi:hypothetical protein
VQDIQRVLVALEFLDKILGANEGALKVPPAGARAAAERLMLLVGLNVDEVCVCAAVRDEA